MAAGLSARGVEVELGFEAGPGSTLLIVGGTRHLPALLRARRRGARLVQRLNGMNWIHRRLPTGVRHYLRAEVNNLLLRLIRDRLAEAVIYQSRFAQAWWEREVGPASAAAAVVYNGVPLEEFHPGDREATPGDRWRLLVVEGNLAGGYEHGLRAAFGLVERLRARLDRPVELVIAGRAEQAVRAGWAQAAPGPVHWLGPVPAGEIPALDRSAHVLYAADLHPACPNAVVEALACGLPVASFDTGALPELVTGDAGRLAGYGGDPWKLDPPDVDGLAERTVEILRNQPRFRQGARSRAENGLGLEAMVEGYWPALFPP
jgi:glycosyltransferase involved in cell wall biosynthesis